MFYAENKKVLFYKILPDCFHWHLCSKDDQRVIEIPEKKLFEGYIQLF